MQKLCIAVFFAALSMARAQAGSQTSIWHKIEGTPKFYMDSALSDVQKLQKYYVVEECNIKKLNFQIKIREAGIVLALSNKDRPSPIKINEDGGLFLYEFEWPIANSGKPRLDTITYTLLSSDLTYTENHTLLIETPVPFDTVAGQKWNNVLFINSNPQTNGGYEFIDYKWFKNKIAISEMQFYSAGPSSKDTLDSQAAYTATMHTKDGMRVSTCEYNAKSIAPAIAKSENTPAGVYFVEE